MSSLRIVAYNFLAGGSRKRAGHWSRLIRDLKADLLLVQECRRPEEAPNERFRPAGEDALVWGRAGRSLWGSAILARSARLSPIAVAGYDGWIVGGTLESATWTNGRPVRAFSVHCPVGDRGYVRTMHEILDRLAPLAAGADLILGGDFNVVVGYRRPEESRTISRGERGILERLAGEFDLISCWQAANPTRALAQTLRWSANRATPYHCDGIFVPRSWMERLTSCRVVRGSRWDELSDHNPVIANFS
ncbi:MAG TPA: endonuclease/exonuclease/phosphatase family protein [Candidatus Polarisedimenticolaceae bacterium]|nr:endonuclease/exonuclease/phosphatase family protein [Candidatus Polarisedimenticolaceae bacterium]